jgi:hypothetical protein
MVSEKPTSPWVLIVVAIIGAAGVIIAAMISKSEPASVPAAISTPSQDSRSQELPANVATMVPTPLVVTTKAREHSLPTTTSQTPDVANLSGVSLRLEDLPPEFKQIPQDELLALGFRMEDIATGYSRNFTGTQVTGYTAYRTNLNFTDAATDPAKFTMVESYIVSPLDKADISRVDLLMQDPKTVAEFFSSTKVGAPIKIFADLPAIGESSLGLETELAADWGLPTRFDLQVINARRQNAWLIIHVYYAKGQQPLVNIGDLASVLDNRIKTAYEQ